MKTVKMLNVNPNESVPPPPDFLEEAPYSPYFNLNAWDHLNAQDIKEIEEFTEMVAETRINFDRYQKKVIQTALSAWNLAQSEVLKFDSQHFPTLPDPSNSDDLSKNPDWILQEFLQSNWQYNPQTDRSMIAVELWNLIPKNADFSRMVLYNTAGTTANPIEVPNHPIAVGKYNSFIENILQIYEVEYQFSANHMGIALIGYQNHTVTFACKLQSLKNSGFAKIDLHPAHWNEATDPLHYLNHLSAEIYTSDPAAIVKLMEMYRKSNLAPYHPKAILLTAIHLNPKIKIELERFFQCPVIDIYSTTETGIIGYACKDGHGYHLIAPDLLVEIRKDNPSMQRGEIMVSGGRNPYFPLIRYRTGDWGEISFEKCSCGDCLPLIKELYGRNPVLFQGTDLTFNNGDIVYLLAGFPVVAFEFHQKQDLTCIFEYCLVADRDPDNYENALRSKITQLIGDSIPLKIHHNPNLRARSEDQKLVPFSNEISFYYD